MLSGRVGTKAELDAAVQTGIATGYPIQDDLVIDTAEVYRAAALAASPGWGPSHAWGIPPLGAGTVPFVYPPPCSAGSTTPFSASNRRWSRILRGLARWPLHYSGKNGERITEDVSKKRKKLQAVRHV